MRVVEVESAVELGGYCSDPGEIQVVPLLLDSSKKWTVSELGVRERRGKDDLEVLRFE